MIRPAIGFAILSCFCAYLFWAAEDIAFKRAQLAGLANIPEIVID